MRGQSHIPRHNTLLIKLEKEQMKMLLLEKPIVEENASRDILIPNTSDAGGAISVDN